MKDKYMHASSTTSSTLPLPADGKQERRRKRGGLFSSLFNTLTPSKTTTGKPNWLPTSLAILLWAGLAYGGYAFAMHTLDKQQQSVNLRIGQVQKENEAQMKAMGEQITLVQDEMTKVASGLTSIQEELQMTGETIGGTDKTKQALQERIDQLNKQLVDLKTSLKKLEDAARAW